MKKIKVEANRWWSRDVAIKVNELVREYNKIIKRLKKDYEHDEVMDGMIGENKQRIEEHINNHRGGDKA